MRKIFNSEGFTLIELIVVFTILAVLSTIGIVAFLGYDQVQSIQAAKNDLSTLLYLAKSRSFSQIVPFQCSGRGLDGYEVRICGLPSSNCISSNVDFEMLVRCQGSAVSPAITTRKLPKNISFDSQGTTSTSFIFPTITGGVRGNGVIAIQGYGQQKTVTVTSTGGIQ